MSLSKNLKIKTGHTMSNGECMVKVEIPFSIIVVAEFKEGRSLNEVLKTVTKEVQGNLGFEFASCSKDGYIHIETKKPKTTLKQK